MSDGRVYYNEFEPRTAAWLRQLIADGHLPDGDVDERSIEDVVPSDLRGYRQCHFFAGIGGWAYALALAGWPGDTERGSCMADADCRGRETAHLPVRSARQDQTPAVERRDSPWSSVDWFPCADGLVRPVGSGVAPLAHGVPARVVRLRGYGNAIVPQVAAEFIRAATEE